MMLKKIAILLFLCVMVVGCTAKDGEAMDREKYGIPVQEYTGIEYPVLEKKARWEYIEQHRKDIEDKAIQWVKESFGLDVKINHVYPKNGAAIATAEWLGDSNLKIKVVLWLDERNERVSGVSDSMDAENNIMSYIAYKVYQEEFNKLELFIEEFCKKENLYGITNEYIHNIGGFASLDRNYYYISAANIDYQKTYFAFLDNPSITSRELRNIFDQEYEEDKVFKAEIGQRSGINLNISLYSYSNKIDDSLFKELEALFVEQSYLPDFNYAFTLNENTVDTRSGRARSVHYPDAPTETGYIKVNKEKE